MGDCGSVIPEMDREEDLIAAARHIAMALGSKKNLTDDAKKILADLGAQLSNISVSNETENEIEGLAEIEKQLNIVQEKIMSWETDQSMIWDSGPDESTQYLNAVDEARKFAEKLEILSSNNTESGEKELFQRSLDILQLGMSRLEEEFKHILIQNRQPFEPEHVSFRSSEDDTADFSSVISLGDDSFEDSINRDSVSRNSEEFIIDLVHPEVISDLRCIANLMFISNYSHECSQAYISVRRDALDECLFILEIEKLSIEDVLKLEWGSLNSKIKRWVRAMKIFVRVYLASEKYLTEQIFGDLGTTTVSLACYSEASKASVLQLLNFGDAISIGPHKPEKLFPILDMYEVLADLIPDIDSLYSDESGFCIKTETREVLMRLGDAVKTAFYEFENAIATSLSLNPFLGGGVHHLTRYVMNYINTLTDYRDTLNTLLVSENGSPDVGPLADEDYGDGSSNDVSPMARRFRSVASILECNLDDKVKLYKDPSLQHIFLMNNIHYMTQKIKNSELRHIFGDEWIRKHNGKFQQHAMNYERATWSSVLALLRDNNEGSSNSDSLSKTLLKEQFRNFNIAFEEVYRTQTAWIIPDPQLREDLQISTSVKVIQAYRTFVGRHGNQLSDKHIKHSADDLEDFLCDLFQGSQKSLHNPPRK